MKPIVGSPMHRATSPPIPKIGDSTRFGHHLQSWLIAISNLPMAVCEPVHTFQLFMEDMVSTSYTLKTLRLDWMRNVPSFPRVEREIGPFTEREGRPSHLPIECFREPIIYSTNAVGSTALATERVERRLAAILAADVAGYSRRSNSAVHS
jgi:hypothetical protein